jgi:PAS domain S-box-containing protein
MPTSSFAPHRFSIRRKVLLGFGLLLAMFAVIAFISWRSTRTFSRVADRVALAHDVLEAQEQANVHLMEMESARRGFLLSGDAQFLDQLQKARQQLLRRLDVLEDLLDTTPQVVARFKQLRGALDQNLALQQAEIDARQRDGLGAADALYAAHASEPLKREMALAFTEIENAQRDALAERAEFTQGIARATMLAIAAGTVLTIGALGFATSVILRDIAARRRAEEALATEHNLLSSIIATMPNYVFLKDAKGRFMLDNAAHRRHLGLDVEESIEGRTDFDYYIEPLAKRTQQDDRHVIETGEPILNREESVQLEGATESTWLETTKVPLRDTDGRVVGLVGISSDITARKAAEEQLKRFAAQLETSNAELQNFASVASHDLQEPLRKIQAFGDRLRTKCASGLGDQGLDYLERMQNAAQRMQVLIHDLLQLSRITSRAQPFERCDLNVLVDEVLSDLEVAIEQHKAVIEVRGLPVIDADPVQMRQLFQNLISNALKFHKPGRPPVVHIIGRVMKAPPGFIGGARGGERVCEIEVTDEGIGFDPKFADQIFVVFQRLHTRTEYEGTGIGLAVCRKITDRHGGRIVAEAGDGKGATFRVVLPVNQPSVQTNETK